VPFGCTAVYRGLLHFLWADPVGAPFYLRIVIVKLQCSIATRGFQANVTTIFIRG